MHTFEFVRPADSAAAVATAAQARTAQQGADVRFVAGGTTLLDLRCTSSISPTKRLTNLAHAASARSAWPVSPPRSRRQSTTQPESACGNCR